jgi:signal transduction histidine kinase
MNILNKFQINTKLLLQFFLVILILTIPIFYLIYFSYTTFEERQSITFAEINGAKTTELILNEFNLLASTNNQTISNELIVETSLNNLSNKYNIREQDKKNINHIFANKNSKTREELADNFLAPLTRLIANNSNLILDPDIDTYYLVDILLIKSPRIYQFLSRDSDFVTIDRLLKQLQIELIETDYSLEQVVKNHLDHIQLMNSITTCHSELKNEVQNQLNDNKLFNPAKISKILNRCNNMSLLVLTEALQTRNHVLLKKYLLTLVFTGIFLIIGSILGLIIYLRIVKEQVNSSLKIFQQEQMIMESEKLSTLGELASSIVHEIKNPLTLIDFETHTLYKKIDNAEWRDETLLKRITKISDMSKRINKISNLITIYTRNSQNDNFEEINCQKILEDAIYIVNLKAKNSSVEIKIDSENILIKCRPHQIEQVIINLLNNSIDAIEKLSDRWISLASESYENAGNKYIRISVTDSGTGINKDVQNNIFKSFFTTKGAGKGTGLGLSVSQKIIESHSGKLYLDQNSLNTKFVIEFPLHQD